VLLVLRLVLSLHFIIFPLACAFDFVLWVILLSGRFDIRCANFELLCSWLDLLVYFIFDPGIYFCVICLLSFFFFSLSLCLFSISVCPVYAYSCIHVDILARVGRYVNSGGGIEFRSKSVRPKMAG